jgi:hypothetical protein
VAVLGTAIVLVAAVAGGPAAGTTADDSTLRVGSAGGLEVGETTTVNVVVSRLPRGFSGTDFNVTVADPSTARVVGATAVVGFGEASVVDDRTAVIRMVDLNRDVQPGARDVTLARVTVAGVGDGTTSLAVADLNLDDENGTDYVPGRIVRGTVRAGDRALVPVRASGAAGRVPTDPDGDGRFEDVSGDGRAGFEDVVALFRAFDDPGVVTQADAYDFNGNDRLDFTDLTELFASL